MESETIQLTAETEIVATSEGDFAAVTIKADGEPLETLICPLDEKHG